MIKKLALESMKNLALIFRILIIVLTWCLALCESTVASSNTKIEISAVEANRLIIKNKNNQKFVILDVRTSKEFKLGHINERAILLNFYETEFINKLSKLDKLKNYLVYCRTGNRSSQVVSMMNKIGFKNIFHLSSGINGWAFHNFPIVR